MSARLLITCSDVPGIVASVSTFLFTHGANITALDQHSTDPEGGEFFMRLEFQTPNLDVTRHELEHTFQDVVASRFNMNWRMSYTDIVKRTAILVSKYDHALMEIVWRWKQGQLPTEISMVISNHPDLRESVESFGIPFHHVPVSKENKEEAEQDILNLLKDEAELIVLARYMQILTGGFISQYPNQIINIHHSFLPAFIGANPYRQAYERGVKLIGATAHYATEDLDAGPIIEQDIHRVSHRHRIPDLTEVGRDVERRVLASAVQWHLEDRIIVHGNKTVVFAA